MAIQTKADEVTVANIQATPGSSSEIIINFSTTATNITGYQMSLYLPEGVTLQKDEDEEYLYTLSNRHNKNHTFSVNEQADGGLMLLCYSLTKKTIASGNGELLRLPVNIAATATGTLTAQLRTIKVSDTSSNVTLLDDVSFNIVCKAEVTKVEQTLSLSSLPTMTVGDAAYSLPATTAEGLALTWSSNKNSVATISGNMLSAQGAGTATITATQAGNDAYLPFERQFTLTVKAAETGGESGEADTDISQLQNVIYVENAEAQADDEFNLSISMKNAAAIRGFQFNLHLPEGITAQKSAKGKYLATLTANRLPDEDEHTLTVAEQEDGSLLFLCGSQYDENFTGTEGEIISLKVRVAENMAVGNYPVVLTDVQMTETDISKYYNTARVKSTLTIEDYVLGDINRDREVNVRDYIGVANHISGSTLEGFNAKAADVDKSGDINVRDYIGVANIILTGSPYGASGSARELVSRRADTDISDTDNVIYVAPLEAEPGTQAQLSICMKNTADIRGFQFNLYLPEGVTVAKSKKGKVLATLTEDRLPDEDEHTLTIAEQADGSVLFLCGSQYDENFTGSDGEIISVTVNIDETLTAGEYPIVLQNIQLTETDISKYYNTDRFETSLTISIPTSVIESMAENKVWQQVYTVSGVKVDHPQHGLHIVRQADGSVRKVMVK